MEIVATLHEALSGRYNATQPNWFSCFKSQPMNAHTWGQSLVRYEVLCMCIRWIFIASKTFARTCDHSAVANLLVNVSLWSWTQLASTAIHSQSRDRLRVSRCALNDCEAEEKYKKTNELTCSLFRLIAAVGAWEELAITFLFAIFLYENVNNACALRSAWWV
jgi:hypothetical protein